MTTNYQSDAETNHTASLKSVTALFDAAGKQAWSARLAAYYPEMDRRASPEVDAYCLYGSGLPTSYSYAFTGKTILEAAPVLVRNMEGDDNQDLFDNSFCQIWAKDLEKTNHVFESYPFPGVGHMSMVSDANVLAKLRDIVASY